MKRLGQVQSAVLCEDIRHDINGQLHLIGVYPTNLFVPSVPVDLLVALYLEFSHMEPKQYAVQVKVLRNADIVAHKEFLTAVAEAGPNVVLARPLHLRISRTGQLRFRVKIADEPWHTVKSVRIDLDPSIEPDPRYMMVSAK